MSISSRMRQNSPSSSAPSTRRRAGATPSAASMPAMRSRLPASVTLVTVSFAVGSSRSTRAHRPSVTALSLDGLLKEPNMMSRLRSAGSGLTGGAEGLGR